MEHNAAQKQPLEELTAAGPSVERTAATLEAICLTDPEEATVAVGKELDQARDEFRLANSVTQVNVLAIVTDKADLA